MKTLLAVLLALCSFMLQAATLVEFSFDDDALETGPDTFSVFQHARGRVRLDTTFNWSGYRSIAVFDVAQDGDFPELQGRFPLQDSGHLHIHFAFMTPTPLQSFNIALAGPGWFSLRPDGIGFWLKNRDGYLFQVSDSMPKRLFTLEPFTWYLVDVDYAIDNGSYDISIHREHLHEPLVALTGVSNATRTPGSRVEVFSFIGDLDDRDNAALYVDDIIIDSDRLPAPDALVAPGRRKLFVDYWRDLQHARRSHPECLPLRDLLDLGIDDDLLRGIAQAGQTNVLQTAIEGRPLPDEPPVLPVISAVQRWNAGCAKLADGEAQRALAEFRTALELVPDARMYELSLALAEAADGNFQGAEDRLTYAYDRWQDDARLGAAHAMIAIAGDDLWSAESILRELSRDLAEHTGQPYQRLWNEPMSATGGSATRPALPERWRESVHLRLITEQYYFVLLWRENYHEALEFTRQVSEQLQQRGISPGIWHEYAGNAALLLADYSTALDAYEAALGDDPEHPGSVYLKLADVFFHLADYEQERYYREQVYGSLAGR